MQSGGRRRPFRHQRHRGYEGTRRDTYCRIRRLEIQGKIFWGIDLVFISTSLKCIRRFSTVLLAGLSAQRLSLGRRVVVVVLEVAGQVSKGDEEWHVEGPQKRWAGGRRASCRGVRAARADTVPSTGTSAPVARCLSAPSRVCKLCVSRSMSGPICRRSPS